jgi:opacity protein-like surface antigen
MRKTLLVILLTLVATSPLSAADLSGKWRVTGSIGEMPIDITCTFKDAKGQLTGSCTAEEIGALTLKGESRGTSVTWKYDVSFQNQDFTVVYKGKLESSTEIKGSISVMDNASGSFTAKKQPKPSTTLKH